MLIIKFFKGSVTSWWTIFTLMFLLVSQVALYAGVSDHLARETRIKYSEGNHVTTISQYSELTYLVELVALGLVTLALLAVTISVFIRLKSGKREQKKILSLRRSAEIDKKAFDHTISEIDNMSKQAEISALQTNEYVKQAADKAQKAEKHAENIENIEVEMIQLVDGSTKRMAHIQDHWEQLLKETTESMDQINTNFEKSVNRATGTNKLQLPPAVDMNNQNNIQSDISTQEISVTEDVNGEIKNTLDLTLFESKELLNQIKEYQQEAKSAFLSFKSTLGGFESQAHEQFDGIFNTADIARQELNASLDESREYMKIFRKRNDTSQSDKKQLVIEKNVNNSVESIETKNKKARRAVEATIKRKYSNVRIQADQTINDCGSLEMRSKNSLSNFIDNDNKNLVSLFTNYKQQ